MAQIGDHISQAKHNKECAEEFLEESNWRDWAITAAFYSAIHFVEAGFTTIQEIEHTELSCPEDIEPHTFRKNKVDEYFGDICFKSYRRLQEASNEVRYLQRWENQEGEALTYYSQTQAKELINRDLEMVRFFVKLSTGIPI